MYLLINVDHYGLSHLNLSTLAVFEVKLHLMGTSKLNFFYISKLNKTPRKIVDAHLREKVRNH